MEARWDRVQNDMKITVEVEKIVPGGDGLAHHRNKTVFIPYSVPGDRLGVKLVKNMRDYAVGEIQNILEASPSRVESPCPLFPRCGGCGWLMIDYKSQLSFKKEIVREAFARQGGIREIPLEDTRRMEHPWKYRNKVIYPLRFSRRRALLGYYERGTHRIVDLTTCPVELAQFERFIGPLKEILSSGHETVYDERRGTGKLRHLIMRGSEKTGETLVLFVVRSPGVSKTLARKIKDLAPEGIIGVAFNVNSRMTSIVLGEKTRGVLGRRFYLEKIRNLTFRISSTSFFQVNATQAENLLSQVEELVDPCEVIVDAYCGVGFFSLGLAHKAKKILGIEETVSSVSDAEANAKTNSLGNVEFTHARVEERLGMIGKPDLLLLDPPRKGLERETIRTLGDRRPRKIIYISCNPVTLARDARAILKYGYDVDLLIPFDFFPHTYHVETLAMFSSRTGSRRTVPPGDRRPSLSSE
jgi:23S rRNA (uracil1939-C5)-methyltransferase